MSRADAYPKKITDFIGVNYSRHTLIPELSDCVIYSGKADSVLSEQVVKNIIMMINSAKSEFNRNNGNVTFEVGGSAEEYLITRIVYDFLCEAHTPAVLSVNGDLYIIKTSCFNYRREVNISLLSNVVKLHNQRLEDL